MTAEEIIKLAAKGKLPEEPLPCPERCLFFAMRDLYRQNKSGEISKEEGRSQKQKVMNQFRHDCEQLDYSKTIFSFHANMWKTIELAGSRYMKEPSIEHADEFVKAVYGVGRIKSLRKADIEENENQNGENAVQCGDSV